MSDLHYFRPDWIVRTDEELDVDVCIYGASSAGVIAAVESVALGKTVALLQPGKFVGGLTAGGLGWTDHGKQHVIGGQTREFFRRVGKHYGKPEEWKFEPHVATAVFEDWLKSAGVTPRFCQYLDRVEMDAGRIARIVLLGGLRVRAKIFIDTSYEGDLLAKAGVTYHVGRESNAVYGETINGIQVHAHHQFLPARISPYIIADDSSSGLLPHVENIDQAPHQGEGDRRVQAYNFRICMTDDPILRIPWEKPDGYNAAEYVLAGRWAAADKDSYNDILPEPDTLVEKGSPSKFDVFPNLTPGGHRKTDTNNHGPISSDYIGANWAWPDGSYELREALFQAHVTYQKGLYWYMANSPEVPERYRRHFQHWGLARDEFVTCGGWSPQLYVREARRMRADYVMTEADVMHQRKCQDPIGMGSYYLDSHNCTRFVSEEGFVMNEGDVQRAHPGPYGISYRSIVPKRGQVTNLLVPVCCSASHIAYGSVRMEPVFMALGESAAAAASLAIDTHVAVQDVPYAVLREELLRRNQVLSV